MIAGATGFIGTTLLEKLLRSCDEIGDIYLLLRPKKNVRAQERLASIFRNLVSKINRNFLYKAHLYYHYLATRAKVEDYQEAFYSN